jgi:hypothetical protein
MKRWILTALLLTAPLVAAAQSTSAPKPSSNDELKSFLQPYASMDPTDTQNPYISANIDFNSRDRGVIVYLKGHDWCGSGGCTMLILLRKGSSYRLVSDTSTTVLPVRELTTSHHGWYDIGVSVCEKGGKPNCYEVALRYNGRRYPDLGDGPKEHPIIKGKTILTKQTPTKNL